MDEIRNETATNILGRTSSVLSSNSTTRTYYSFGREATRAPTKCLGSLTLSQFWTCCLDLTECHSDQDSLGSHLKLTQKTCSGASVVSCFLHKIKHNLIRHTVSGTLDLPLKLKLERSNTRLEGHFYCKYCCFCCSCAV
jgi:hypothetical protein